MARQKNRNWRSRFLSKYFLSFCVIGYRKSVSVRFSTNHTAYAPIDTSFLEKMRLNAIFD